MAPADPAPIGRIDYAWIRAHAALRLQCHIAMADRHILTRSVVDNRDNRPIGLSVTIVTYKCDRRLGNRAGKLERRFHVDGHAEPLATLDEALEILRIVRIGAQPDVVVPLPVEMQP
ncbi:MAG: hypothetical protein BGP16_05385 [Sphingobium sp. 66-54]|nr:MAG: hypothetical protein BGP16_05385 [Sphingobium sp. 66-54]